MKSLYKGTHTQTLSRGVVTKKKSVDLYETVDEVFQMLDKTLDRLIKNEVLKIIK